MNQYLTATKKYILLLLIGSIFEFIWFYLLPMLLGEIENPLFLTISPAGDYFWFTIKIIMVILLFADFQKREFKHYWPTFLCTLFYPLLGLVVFSILLLKDDGNKSA